MPRRKGTIMKIAIANGDKGTLLEALPSHGSPADRGSADRYYGRPCVPHYWPNGTGNGIRIEQGQMTEEQVEEYTRAWLEETDRKNWG